MDVYLDNSATTKPHKEVSDLVTEVMKNIYGNPSSMHTKGLEAERVIKTAKEQVAATLRCSPSELYITSGGTEASNLAIIGACNANKGRHIITSAVEHPATLRAMNYLQSHGYDIDILDVDSQGLVDLKQLNNLICHETVLVSIMHVNNEIGTVEPIQEIGRLIKHQNPHTLFHVDAVQSYCKLPVSPANMLAEFVTLSSHKIHGPKGIGALYVKNGTRIKPIMFGGGQQKDIRPGTENVAGIAGFGLAANISMQDMPKKIKWVSWLRDMLMRGILSNIKYVSVNTPSAFCAPHILNVSFDGVRSEVLLHSLAENGIFVSSGSACSSNKKGARSYVLKSIGLSDRWIDGRIRFSLSEYTKDTDIEYTIMKLCEIVPKLRSIRR